MRSLKRASVVVAVVSVLLVPGCRKPTVRSETLVIAQIASAVTLDPHLHDELSTYSCLAHFFGRLVSFGPEMNVRPELAVHWENPTETVWRFHLRRGVVFHDGRPFGAPDVVASLKRARAMPGSLVRYYLEAVDDVRAIDDSVVEVRTRYPAPVLLNKLVFIGIVPRDTAWTAIRRPVGTGPYRYVSGSPGGPIHGDRFTRFWGSAPAFEHVTVLPMPDDKERAEAIPAGKADVVSFFPEQYWKWGQQLTSFRLIARPGLTVVMLGFSLRPGSPFADSRVRRAVAMTVDRSALVSRERTGFAVPMDQIVPHGVFGYSEELRSIERDEARAVSLLEEAGLSGGVDAGFLLPDTLEPLGREVASQLAVVGIRLKPTVLPWPAFLDRWSREGSPVALFGWAAATGDVSDAWDELLRQSKGSTSNNFSYKSPELGRLIDLSGSTLEPSTRLGYLRSAMRLIHDDLPVLPLIAGTNLYAIRSDLTWSARRDRQIYAFDIRPRKSR